MTEQVNDDPIMAFFRHIDIIHQLSQHRVAQALPDKMQVSHFVVLCHMVRVNKAESPAELARIFQVSRPSMSNTLQKLESAAYIKVESNKDDGRSKKVSISKHGIDAQKQALAAIAPVFSDIINELGVSTFQQSLESLTAISTYLDKHRA